MGKGHLNETKFYYPLPFVLFDVITYNMIFDHNQRGLKSPGILLPENSNKIEKHWNYFIVSFVDRKT